MEATVQDEGAVEGQPVDSLSYTEASRELDDIVRFFEQREVDVDHLVTRLERATSIIEELDQRLRRTRVQVEQLVPKLEAVLGSDGDRAGDRQQDTADAGAPGGGPAEGVRATAERAADEAGGTVEAGEALRSGEGDENWDEGVADMDDDAGAGGAGGVRGRRGGASRQTKSPGLF